MIANPSFRLKITSLKATKIKKAKSDESGEPVITSMVVLPVLNGL
jgi:hypothetical protein